MEEMDDGELVCFTQKQKPFRLKSMNAERHPQLKNSNSRTALKQFNFNGLHFWLS
jgi:hypothetical protein